MKRPHIVFCFWSLLATTILWPRYVKGFELHTTACSKSHNTARRTPTLSRRHPHGIRSDAKEIKLSSVFRTKLADDASYNTRDTSNRSSSRKEVNVVIRSTLSIGLVAFAIDTSSFAETASAEILSQSAPDFQTTVIVADSSMDSLPPTTQGENGGSPAGNAVLAAWVGISGFAGIKGVYDRFQQEEEDQ